MAMRVDGERPPGSTVLTESEALEYQENLLADWKPQSEVWPLRYSCGVLGSISVMTAAYINNGMRKKLRLLRYGLLSSTSAIAGTAGVFCTLLHVQHVRPNILLFKYDCPMCIEARSLIVQCGTGIVQPLVTSPLLAFVAALHSGSYSIPHYTDIRGIFRLWKSMVKPLLPALSAFVAIHTAASSIATYYELKSMEYVRNIMLLLEEEERERTRKEENTDREN